MWKFTPSFFDFAVLPASARRCGSATTEGSRAPRASARASPFLDFPVNSMASQGKGEKPREAGLGGRDNRTHQALTQINLAYPPRTTVRPVAGLASRQREVRLLARIV